MINNSFTRWLARRLTARAHRIITRRLPDIVIGGAADPYLRRWYLLPRNPLCNAYLHQFLRSDDDRALHDHPWSSLSLALGSAGIWEVYQAADGAEMLRAINAGDLVYRGARFAHRLIVPADCPAMTLFVTGPRIRQWGFLCPQGWRHWREFTASHDRGDIGRGCE